MAEVEKSGVCIVHAAYFFNFGRCWKILFGYNTASFSHVQMIVHVTLASRIVFVCAVSNFINSIQTRPEICVQPYDIRVANEPITTLRRLLSN